jgi:hypothetical protein
MLAGMNVVRLVGVYNADGGIVGEVRYVIGHLLGTTECALCDITHSPLRRKPEWDAMVAGLGIPLEVLHRNEVGEDIARAIAAIGVPAIIGLDQNGGVQEVLSAEDLRRCNGSVTTCGAMVVEKLASLNS